VTDREVVPGCARVRTKCTEKTSIGLWGQSRDPRELPGVTGPGHGVAGVLQSRCSTPCRILMMLLLHLFCRLCNCCYCTEILNS
jgi:hypothetical protein